MSTDPKLDPSTLSAAYSAMQSVWAKIDTVLAGTESMRCAGPLYLPHHPEESEKSYAVRLAMATLFNQAEMTLESWVGRPFGEKLEIGQDVPKEILDLFPNIDLQGNQLAVFVRHWFKHGLAKSFAHVLIDFPRVNKAGRTKADDAAEKVRPYWTFIQPENLIFASSDFINGREVLTHVRIRESVLVRNGFAEVERQSIRIFNRDLALDEVTVEVWSLLDGKEWTRTEPAVKIDINEIPIVTFYADRCGLMLGKPPLEDLVDLNISHWQSTADQRNILTVARFPILAVSGLDNAADSTEAGSPERTMALGPKKILSTTDTQGKWYYVEHQGNAIAAGRIDLQDLEAKMSHYGAEFLMQRPGSTTATARALDTAESTSPLQDAVIRFNDAILQAMVITGKWLSLAEKDTGTVTICTDFTAVGTDQYDYIALQTARVGRDISRLTLVRELQRRGTLSDDYDQEVDLEELKNEDMAALGAPVSGKPIDAQAQNAPPPAAPPKKEVAPAPAKA